MASESDNRYSSESRYNSDSNNIILRIFQRDKFTNENISLCNELFDYLRKQEKNLPKIEILVVPSTRKTICSECSKKQEKEIIIFPKQRLPSLWDNDLPENEISENEISEKEIECTKCIAINSIPQHNLSFKLILKTNLTIKKLYSNTSFKELRISKGNDIDLRNCIIDHFVSSRKYVSKYFVLKNRRLAAYITKNDLGSDYLESYIYPFFPENFTVQEEKPEPKKQFFVKSVLSEVFHDIELIFPCSIVKTHMNSIIDAFVKCDFNK